MMSPEELAAYFTTMPGYAEHYRAETPLGHLFAMRLARLAELLSGVDAARVLDVGCGPCMPVRVLSPGTAYFGVDIASARLKECVDSQQFTQPVRLAVASLDALPIAEQAFDLVLCLGVLEYAADANAAVAQLAQIIRPGGTLIVSMLNPLSPYRRWYDRVYRGSCWRTARRLARRHEPREPALRLLSARQLRDLLYAQGGMETFDVTYYDFNLWLAPLDRLFPALCLASTRRLERLAHGKLKWLCTAYMIKATRHSPGAEL